MTTQEPTVTGRRGSGRTKTRDHLMDVAAQLFADKGYAATTVPDIVKAAGTGHGTFYEYFGSRREILVAITERAGQTTMPPLTAGPGSFADQLRAEVHRYLTGYVAHLTLSRIWHSALNFDPEVAEIVSRARTRRTREVRDAIAAAGAGGGLDPSGASVALTSMIEEFAFRWFVSGEGPGTDPEHVEAAADLIATIFLRSLDLDGDAV